jgi:hypothetical protein
MSKKEMTCDWPEWVWEGEGGGFGCVEVVNRSRGLISSKAVSVYPSADLTTFKAMSYYKSVS